MFTDTEYANAACEANEKGMLLYVLVDKETGDESLLIAPVNYYVCEEGTNRTDGTLNENYEADLIKDKREELNNQNLAEAKNALENGFIVFKGVRIETNTQTCNDLLYAKEVLSFGQVTEIDWLSKDDEHISINLEDLIEIGKLITMYKNSVWQDKYDVYRQQIETAETLEDLNKINIDYTVQYS